MKFTDILDISSRERTPEGFLRVKAAITRVGVLTYDAGYLGLGQPGQTIRAYQTPESVFHPETIASARGLPVTLDHPDQGEVTPDNYRWLQVGNVMDTPKQLSDGRLGADLFIGDKDAIETIEAGRRQLSVGKTFDLVPSEDLKKGDYLTRGPILFNHIALVDSGRAGSEVQVFDKALSAEEEMKLEELPGAVAKAVSEELAKGGKAPRAADTAAIGQAVSTALTPVVEIVQGMKTAQDKAEVDRKAAELKKETEAAGKKLVDDTRAEERARQSVLTKALPLIPEDKHAGLDALDTKAILVLAVGDNVPNAAQQDEGYLRGALDQLAFKQANIRSAVGNPSGAPKPAEDSVGKAMDSYMSHLQNAHKRIYGKPEGKAE